MTTTISILGSTGSIGCQTLEILDLTRDEWEINFLTVNTKIAELEQQIKKYHPRGVAISDTKCYLEFKRTTSFTGEILCGEEGVCAAAGDSRNVIVMSALVGFSGVMPTLAAIETGATIALANKETLVSAGDIITKAAQVKNVKILAVDSEHSAILQCLIGESSNEIEKIILTASGGPFRELPKEEFESISLAQALRHPNWSMGNKITIDSATMMNKGFEVIEAKWLFNVPIEKIEVLVHPQSIIHSMVQFQDGSIKAQLGTPDMRVPIGYALHFPHHKPMQFPRLDLAAIGQLTFSPPDYEKFPCLQLAFDAVSMGGASPAILNAANEIAVQAFLKEEIRFIDIPVIIHKCMDTIQNVSHPTLSELTTIDEVTRSTARQECLKLR
ncbi:MAG: 1-deoxy-D-xylulose-5-phosphate reductoisomerase [Ignavibacteria bacterium]|nr:1-deoxy-D-xylulose-5-phosphate reductoisomerase [Ignavibacteria bacterium]